MKVILTIIASLGFLSGWQQIQPINEVVEASPPAPVVRTVEPDTVLAIEAEKPKETTWQDNPNNCKPNRIRADTLECLPDVKLVEQPQLEAVTTASVTGSIEQIVRDAAIAHGIDPDHFVRIAQCESSMNPNAVNSSYYENGNPSGLYQHLSGYWPKRAADHGYAGASIFDAVANANVTASMWASGSSRLWECQ